MLHPRANPVQFWPKEPFPVVTVCHRTINHYSSNMTVLVIIFRYEWPLCFSFKGEFSLLVFLLLFGFVCVCAWRHFTLSSWFSKVYVKLGKTILTDALQKPQVFCLSHIEYNSMGKFCQGDLCLSTSIWILRMQNDSETRCNFYAQ